MYLSARKYINKIDWSKMKESDDYDSATRPEYVDVVKSAGLEKVANKDIYGAEVSVNVAYWRKVNAIHQWFVDNCQDGVDECQSAYVSQDQLKELLALCRQSLLHKDPSKLMPQAGFFFGSYDIDEYYWGGIKYTIEQLKRIVELPEFDELSFYYQSSW